MLASVSCEKKETVKEAQSSVEKADMTFKAVPAGTARTTVLPDGTTVVWSDGDAIKVFANGAESGDVCGMISGAGDTYAEFSGQCAAQGPWTAICPAYSEAKLVNGAIEFTMPDEQYYAENTFAPGAMPCVAYSETTEFTFNHSFGVLKLSLKLASGKTGSVKSIKVTDKNGVKLNGTFAVSPKTSAKATAKGTDGTNAITLNCITDDFEEGVELSETATDFWIVVPADAFKGGFDVVITSTDDIEAILSTESDNTIKEGEIKPMPEKEIEFKEPIKDACGNKYNTVAIGTQVWFRENVRCNKYDTESEAYKAGITTISKAIQINYTPSYAEPKNRPDYMTEEQFGKLGFIYNWAAAMGYNRDEAWAQEGAYTGKRQGVCPNGWHIPSLSEWDTLVNTLGGTDIAGKKMKTSTGWISGTGEGDNGFAALPAGYGNGPNVYYIGERTNYWSSSANQSYYAYNSFFDENDKIVLRSDTKDFGMSVRCLKN